jgi:hypothetical protein
VYCRPQRHSDYIKKVKWGIPKEKRVCALTDVQGNPTTDTPDQAQTTNKLVSTPWNRYKHPRIPVFQITHLDVEYSRSLQTQIYKCSDVASGRSVDWSNNAAKCVWGLESGNLVEEAKLLARREFFHNHEACTQIKHSQLLMIKFSESEKMGLSGSLF